MVQRTHQALLTEPLLDESTALLSTRRPSHPVARWLRELAEEPDLVARSRALWSALRQKLDEPALAEMLEGILIHAALGRGDGVGALSALLAVQSPGDALLERTREFRHLHRLILRLIGRQDRDGRLADAEACLVDAWRELDGQLRAEEAAGSGPSDPVAGLLDQDPVSFLRRTLEGLVAELEVASTLERPRLALLVRLVRLELDAAELRATELARAIDPCETRHVTRVMPILSALGADVRDLRSFLDRLERSQRPGLLHEKLLLMRDHLSAEDEQKLQHRLSSATEIHLVRRMLLGLDRHPLPIQTLGYFVDRILAAGRNLREAQLRRADFNLVEATLTALEFHRDGMVTVPAGEQTRQVLLSRPVEGVHVFDGSVRVFLDPSAARRTPLPLGLPSPELDQDEEESRVSRRADRSVKKLLMTNMNNPGTLLGLLRNPKILSTPGAVAMVAQRTRSLRVLEIIAETRGLYSGQANRDVPLALLQSPLPLPIKTLRRFINVRYVSKIDLRRLANDRSAIRREVGEEIRLYLRTLA